MPEGVTRLQADLALPDALSPGALDQVDAVLSCMASRSGAPADAWAVDYAAAIWRSLRAAQAAGVGQFVLLSAICVQKPACWNSSRAKLAFEAKLQASGPVPFHHSPDRVFQIAFGAGGAGAGWQAVPAIRRWSVDGVQTHLGP